MRKPSPTLAGLPATPQMLTLGLWPAVGRAMGRESAVLDLGCGTSRLLRDLRDAGHRGPVVGSDIAGVALARRCCA